MTIAATARNDYLSVGNTDEFDFTFPIWDEEDLLVTVRDTDGDDATLVLDTNYTVSVGPWPSGGTITLTAGNLTTGYFISIRRVRSLAQESDFRNQALLRPADVELALDQLAAADQQQQDELDRCLKTIETRAVGPGFFFRGIGSPNGKITAGIGALYINLTGGASTTLYVKESGAGTDTGWVAK